MSRKNAPRTGWVSWGDRYPPRSTSGAVREEDELGETPLRWSWGHGEKWTRGCPSEGRPEPHRELSPPCQAREPSQNMPLGICRFYGPGATASSLFSMGFFFLLFRPALQAYGGFQAKGRTGSTAAGLHHSHSNAGSELHLQPTPQLMATLDPYPTECGQGSNPQHHTTSCIRFRCATMGTPLWEFCYFYFSTVGWMLEWEADNLSSLVHC